MDRRTFNKSLVGLVSTLFIPIKLPEAAAAIEAVPVGHYGLKV